MSPLGEAGGGGLRAGFARNPIRFPPPRFGEGVRGWGRRARRAREDLTPQPPLRSGEGEPNQNASTLPPDPTAPRILRRPPRSGQGEPIRGGGSTRRPAIGSECPLGFAVNHSTHWCHNAATWYEETPMTRRVKLLTLGVLSVAFASGCAEQPAPNPPAPVRPAPIATK